VISAIRGTREDIGGGFFLKDMSMSTSGSYEKFFRAEGKILRPYYGPAHGLSGAGAAFRFRLISPTYHR